MGGLRFPDWCSVIDQREIQSALDRACPPVVIPDLSAPLPPGIWVPELVAVQRVVNVAQVVASRLPVPFPKAHRPDLEQLLAQIILRVAAQRTSPSSALPVFETLVKDALAQCSWWPATGKATKTSTVAAMRAVARRQVVLPLLERLDWSPTKWALEAGVDPSVTLDYLDGISRPRRLQRERITETLAAALKRAVQLPD